MTRPIDRALGKSPPAPPEPFATRPFGVSAAEAARIAAAAAAARANYPTPSVAGATVPTQQAGGRPAGATGGAGAETNLTTSSAPSPNSSGSQLP